MMNTQPLLEHSEIETPSRIDIKKYLKESKLKGTKFYVQKRRLGESVLRAIEFNLNDIDNNDNLINYLLQTEKQGDKIFVRNPQTGIKRVYFSNN